MVSFGKILFTFLLLLIRFVLFVVYLAFDMRSTSETNNKSSSNRLKASLFYDFDY